MDEKERELAEAAASLTAEDFQWLQSHSMIPETTEDSGKEPHSRVRSAQEEKSSQEAGEVSKKGKRLHVEHKWPDVGTILEADYHGQHYEAEVIEAPRFKSGKALRILSGPAASQVCRSLSGAMLKATEKQREEQGLAKEGVPNGWTFWKVPDGR